MDAEEREFVRGCLGCLSDLASRMLVLAAKGGTRYLVKQQTNVGSACTNTLSLGGLLSGGRVRARVETLLGDWRKGNYGVQLRSHTFQEYCEKDNLGVFLLSWDNAGVCNSKSAHLTSQLEKEDAQGQRRFTSAALVGRRPSIESNTKNS